jgi:hypothetical protein
MADLAGLLGQDRIAAQLVAALDAPGTKAVRLTGAAGSGKSYTARLVARSWVDQGGRCVVAVGDDDHSWRELYPLLSGLSWTHSDWVGLAQTGARSALRVADSALGPAGVTTSVFDLLGAAFRQKAERGLKPYSNSERDVLMDLRRLARSDRLLLVADNAHWWDADSLTLIKDVLSEPLRELVPQLSRVVLFLVDTAGEQTVVAPALFDGLLAACVSETMTASCCVRDQYEEVLRELGLEEALPPTVLDALFLATRGHLKLAEQIVAYAESNTVGALVSDLENGYLSSLITARFTSLGSFSPGVAELLAKAAVLGLSFTEDDLACIAGLRGPDVRTLIELAEEIGFVEASTGRITFSHDVIRAAILDDQTPSQLRALHSKLAECQSILRPGDYAARAHALLASNDREGARDMLVLALVGEMRRGLPPERVVSRAEQQLPGDQEVLTYVELLTEGYLSVDTGDFSRSLPRLRTPMSSESALMAAERDYVAALCLMELETHESVADAIRILESWLPHLDSEVELRLRFLASLQQAQLHCDLFDEARDTETAIERQLYPRRRYDRDAPVLLQIQNRRSSSLNAPEVAESRIREAVAFFRRGSGDFSRDQRELYRSLTNLSAIELRLGKHPEAYGHGSEAERIAVDATDVVHRLDVLASNLVLAAYRADVIPLAEAVIRQRLIIDSPDGSPDAFCERLNLSAYLLLSGETEQAAEEVAELGEVLRSRSIQETYLIYYQAALCVAVAAFSGDADEALRRHTSMNDFVASLRWPCAPYVQRRQELLTAVLRTFEPSDPVSDDKVLFTDHPEEIGAAWGYYGRLAPCAELSFWSDS